MIDRQIVVLNEIHDIARSGVSRDYTLFGNKNYIQDGEKLYDLLFHTIPGIPTDKLKQTTPLVTPVFSRNESYEVEIERLKKQYPWLELFAIENNKPCIETSEQGQKLRPQTLKFLDVKDSDLGYLIKPVDKFRIVNERDLALISPEPERFIEFLKAKREYINQQYRTI